MEIYDKLRRGLVILIYLYFDVDECWLTSSMPQQRLKLQISLNLDICGKTKIINWYRGHVWQDIRHIAWLRLGHMLIPCPFYILCHFNLTFKLSGVDLISSLKSAISLAYDYVESGIA